MTTEQINDTLQYLFGNLGVRSNSLTNEADFTKDLGLDSLDVTDLLLQVEDSFGIRIPDDDWWMLKTIGQLKTYLATETFSGINQP